MNASGNINYDLGDLLGRKEAGDTGDSEERLPSVSPASTAGEVEGTTIPLVLQRIACKVVPLFRSSLDFATLGYEFLI